jgi:hypothetical protein
MFDVATEELEREGRRVGTTLKLWSCVSSEDRRAYVFEIVHTL